MFFLQSRRANGILPSDSVAMEKSDRLRRERQSEYLDYTRKAGSYGPNRGGGFGSNPKRAAPSTPKKSVAEIRKNMSREREQEIHRNRPGPGSKNQEPKRGDDYAAMRERKLAEERQYRGKVRYHDDRRRQDEDSEHPPRARFGNDRQRHWEEEEMDLMEWTRNQTHQRAPHRAQTPPTTRKSTSRSSLRSISAPVVAPAVTGIAALGRYDDSHTKRLRQLKYAEELRSQMREKQQKSPRVNAWRNTEKQSGAEARDRHKTEPRARGKSGM